MPIIPLLIIVIALIVVFLLLQRLVEPRLNAMIPPVGTIVMVVYILLVAWWVLAQVGVLPSLGGVKLF